jgi:hypothetical protein
MDKMYQMKLNVNIGRAIIHIRGVMVFGIALMELMKLTVEVNDGNVHLIIMNAFHLKQTIACVYLLRKLMTA